MVCNPEAADDLALTIQLEKYVESAIAVAWDRAFDGSRR